MNNCVFIGRLTRAPELKTSASGKSYVKFTLAVDREDANKTTDFLPFVAWNKTAEVLVQYTTKGSPLAVVGKLTSKKWETETGENRYIYEIIADKVKFLSPKSGQGNQEAPAQQAPAQAAPIEPPAPPQLEQASFDDYITDTSEPLPFDIMP